MSNDGEGRGSQWEQRLLLSGFIETTQYYQFVEQCEACKEYHDMGVCYGDAGVGKTLSACRYTQWEQIKRVLAGDLDGAAQVPSLKMAFYTPEPLVSAKRFEQEILQLHAQMKMASSLTLPAAVREARYPRIGYPVVPLEWSLLLIDEADRLKPMALEVLRDLFDRSQMGVVLIGMSGLERRLKRYPQFYSRVGFLHEFCTLGVEDLREIFAQQWNLMKQAGDEEVQVGEVLDEEALAAIIRITEGNFRLIHRLLQQVVRILRINRLTKVTKAVVETARRSLLIGREE